MQTLQDEQPQDYQRRVDAIMTADLGLLLCLFEEYGRKELLKQKQDS